MTDRVAVVTGGLSGIGAAAAQYLAGQGWTTVVLDQARGEVPTGVVLHEEPVDVTNEADLGQAFDRIETRHGAVTGLVNSAGVQFIQRGWVMTFPASSNRATARSRASVIFEKSESGRRLPAVAGVIPSSTTQHAIRCRDQVRQWHRWAKLFRCRARDVMT
jgi:NAD(P)-dependent dehydrogenase (short-subunit alcohol dehydrogenase family)